MNNYKTHRCKGSLKSGVSIRKNYNHYYMIENSKSWVLFDIRHDSEYGTIYMSKVSDIIYCPFCGVGLEQ